MGQSGDSTHSHRVNKSGQRHISRAVEEVVRHKGCIASVLEVEADNRFAARSRLTELQSDGRSIVD